ncbi:hypothetical protein OCF84_20785 (plasmid) [Shewanella xiamenensis]|uniref:Lipoprotein n=2 Tax=Shewanella xiamenensis TaxID=332186 RepID=A0ABT6UFP7_9GAMM|nr:hypothetical protein [Shewanella xiamenensis]MDI5833295.1 hypothetical protein [Shewanella xiamenensis]WHF57955.1 hypothetical protein OCF84_20785 [Shewanella xiamenensis]
MNMRYGLVFVLPLLSLTGCVSSGATSSVYNTVDMSPIDAALLASAEAAQKSLLVMEQNNNYKTHKALSEKDSKDIYEQANYVPVGLDIPITMNQRLPIQKSVALICDVTGYSLVTINPPKVDISESVFAYARPAVEVLRDLGSRLADRAIIRVIPNPNPTSTSNNGIIQLEYPVATGAVQ